MNANSPCGATGVVLTTGKMSGNRADYYEDIADGREDYYADGVPDENHAADPAGDGSQQPTARREDGRGRWLGRGAEQLGLSGSLYRGELSRLVSDLHPRTGELLAARKRIIPTHRQGPNDKRITVVPVSGWDLTFSAPKSVSVLYALGEPEVRDAIRDAHDDAVTAALGYVERHAAFTRRGAGGVDIVPGDGFIAAAFRHITSRAGDPQLHSHVVVSNLIQAAGRYTRLDARPLLVTLKTGGYVYQAALREQLTQRLGLEWRPTVNGHADVAGVPDRVLEAFSTRSQEIAALMDERGQSSAGAAQVAALATRAAKDYAVSTPELRLRWEAVAAEHQFGPENVGAVLTRAAPHAPSDQQLQAIAGRLLGPDGLTAEASSFAFRDVVRAWAQAHPAGASPQRLEQLAVWTLQQPGVREIDRTPHGATYSTQELLDLETDLTTQATQRADEQTAVAPAAAVEAAIARRPSMTEEQAAAVRSLTRSGAGIEVVRGYAGAGKTYALEAAREAWNTAGIPVYGAAIAGKAAEGLQLGSGIPSSTIARLLADLQDGHELPHGSVLVIDEAGMAGTRTLHQLATHTARARAKLVLVGDDAQLPELEAGGSFRALADTTRATELVEVRRQRDPGDIRLLAQVRNGAADRALDTLAATGRLVTSATGDATRERLVADWLRDEQGQLGRGVILVRSRDDERDLNHRARTQLRDAGLLDEDLLQIDGRAFARGDRVICGRNRPSYGVTNGTTATVETRHNGSLVVRTDAGALVELPLSYVAGRRTDGRSFLEHAYAITTAGAQGATWQRSYVLADERTYQQEAYTQLSRHTHHVRLYLTQPDQQLDDHAPVELTPTATSQNATVALARAMSRSQAKGTATQTAHDAQDLRLAPTDTLRRELAGLQALLDIAAQELRRAETIDRQIAQATATLQRFDTRSRKARLSRAQKDTVIKLKQRAGDLRSERHQLGTPGTDTAPLQRAEVIRGELHRRQAIEVSAEVRAAAQLAPPHLTAALGPQPQDANARAAWDRGAQIIESYRRRFAPTLASDQAGLGPLPRTRDERRAWYAFDTQLRTAREELGRESRTATAGHDRDAP